MINKNLRARHLLSANKRTSEDFDAFCLDFFPQCKSRFTASMNRLERENLLLEVEGPENVISALSRNHPLKYGLWPLSLVSTLAVGVVFLIIAILIYKFSYVFLDKRSDLFRESQSSLPKEKPSRKISDQTVESGLINTGIISTKGPKSPIKISSEHHDKGVIINQGIITTEGNESGLAIGGTRSPQAH